MSGTDAGKHTRREFLKVLGVTAGALMIPGAAFGRRNSARKPNVVLIFTDDQGTIDVNCYGVKLPGRKIDGKSIASVIESEDAPSPHEVFHWEISKHWAIRQGDWKLVHNGPATDYNGRRIPQVENFLSNMADDVTETRNLAAANPEIVKRLANLHSKWLKDLKQE